MTIQDLYDVIMDDLLIVEELIGKAQHRLQELRVGIHKLKEKEDGKNRPD